MTDDFEEERSGRKARRTEQELRREVEHHEKRSERLERELEAAIRLRKSVDTFAITPSFSSGQSEATAFAVLSDTHYEELVERKKVNGLNEYNLEIAKQRNDEFFQRVVRLVRKERQDVKIKELVLVLGGDHITGAIHLENLENCLLRPVEAIVYAQTLIQSGIEFILNHLTDVKLTVVCLHGNHSRITHKMHASTLAGNSLELMMYHMLAQRFSRYERVKFVIADGYFVYLDVYDWKVRLHHGDAIKSAGGVGGIFPPLLRKIYQWNLSQPANLDVLGHFHQFMSARRFVVNGSMIGYNPYAIQIGAECEPPAQSFFLMDRKRGKTVSIPILFSV